MRSELGVDEEKEEKMDKDERRKGKGRGEGNGGGGLEWRGREKVMERMGRMIYI